MYSKERQKVKKFIFQNFFFSGRWWASFSFQNRRKRQFYFSCFFSCADKSEGHFKRVWNSYQNGSTFGCEIATSSHIFTSHNRL